MGFKLSILLALVTLFMDPCDKKPRNIELRDVPEACSSEVGRMFVRVKGRMQPASAITCRNHPGGRRCETAISTESGEDVVPVLIKGSEKRDGQTRYESVLVGPKGVSGGSLDPYTVSFDDTELFDRNGIVVDHVNGLVDLSGSLRVNEDTKRCSLLVLHVESGTK